MSDSGVSVCLCTRKFNRKHEERKQRNKQSKRSSLPTPATHTTVQCRITATCSGTTVPSYANYDCICTVHVVRSLNC